MENENLQATFVKYVIERNLVKHEIFTFPRACVQHVDARVESSPSKMQYTRCVAIRTPFRSRSID